MNDTRRHETDETDGTDERTPGGGAAALRREQGGAAGASTPVAPVASENTASAPKTDANATTHDTPGAVPEERRRAVKAAQFLGTYGRAKVWRVREGRAAIPGYRPHAFPGVWIDCLGVLVLAQVGFGLTNHYDADDTLESVSTGRVARVLRGQAEHYAASRATCAAAGGSTDPFRRLCLRRDKIDVADALGSVRSYLDVFLGAAQAMKTAYDANDAYGYSPNEMVSCARKMLRDAGGCMTELDYTGLTAPMVRALLGALPIEILVEFDRGPGSDQGESLMREVRAAAGLCDAATNSLLARRGAA